MPVCYRCVHFMEWPSPQWKALVVSAHVCILCRLCMHTHTYACAHTPAHAHTHIRTHARTQVQTLLIIYELFLYVLCNSVCVCVCVCVWVNACVCVLHVDCSNKKHFLARKWSYLCQIIFDNCHYCYCHQSSALPSLINPAAVPLIIWSCILVQVLVTFKTSGRGGWDRYMGRYKREAVVGTAVQIIKSCY